MSSGKCAPWVRRFYRDTDVDVSRAPFPSALILRGPAQLPRQCEDDLLLAAHDLPRGLGTPAGQLLDDLLHENLRSGGAGGHADDVLAVEPFAVQVRGSIDQVAGYSPT